MCEQLSAGSDPGPHATSYLTAFLPEDPAHTDLHEGRGAAVTGSTANQVLVVGRRESLPPVVAGVSLCARVIRCRYLTQKTAACKGFSNRKNPWH